MINDFISREDLPLFTSGSRFSLAKVFLGEGMKDTWATFDLLVRELPAARNFLVFAGLEHVVDYLLNLKFTSAQLTWLKKSFNFSEKEMNYWRNFRFTGDVYAMPEGSIFFPQEPVIRITAPIIEAQLIEMYLINAVYVQTILASKMARFVQAAHGKETYLGFNRCYGTDAAMKSIRVGQIVGIGKQSLALAGIRDASIPLMKRGTFHYLMQVFPSELEAMRAYMRHAPSEGSLLIDTYGMKQGLKNFMIAAKELKAQGHPINRIMLDSGDLLQESRRVRKALDKAGLQEVHLTAMSNLDEYRVAALEKGKASIDAYAAVTSILTPEDAPTLELVYKLAEVGEQGNMSPVMKTSAKKVSFPGRKQVYRVLRGGRAVHDVLGLEGEKVNGESLLVPVMQQGKLVKALPMLSEIHHHYETQKKMFPLKLFNINKHVSYPVRISQVLQTLTKKTRALIKK